MTAPTPEHEDAVARAVDPDIFDATVKRSSHPAAVIQIAARKHMATLAARNVLTTTDPAAQAALAASLPAEVMLAALARREPECKECAAFIDSRCIGCKCCNHSWRDDCGCDLKSCGCGEARRDREAVTP